MKEKNVQKSLLVISSFFLFFGLANAQNETKVNQWIGMTGEEKAAKKDEVKANMENRWQTVTCKKVETRMQARYQKYETNKALHKQTYDKVNTKVETIIADFKAKGYDVSELEADLAQLETKIAKLYTDHDALIQKMKEISKDVCVSTRENLETKIQEIQKYRLETIKVDVLDIRTFYSTVLRPDMVKLIQEVKTSVSPTATPSN